MNQERLRYLFHRYFNADSTIEENQELSELIRYVNEEELSKLLLETWENLSPTEQVISNHDTAKMVNDILSENHFQAPVVGIQTHSRQGWWRYLSAAAVLLLLVGATYLIFFTNKEKQNPPVTAVQPANDLQPA